MPFSRGIHGFVNFMGLKVQGKQVGPNFIFYVQGQQKWPLIALFF
jgi:hypothetical protein